MLEIPEKTAKDMTTFTKDPAAIEGHCSPVACPIVEPARL